jgi:glycosyltransferase involved in cell wall biosynthesis
MGTQNKHKILHVTPWFPPDKSGIANHVLNVCLNLVKHGNDITIVTPRRIKNKIEIETKDLADIIRIRSIHLPGWPYPTLRSVSIPLDMGWTLDSIIRKGGFSIVHAHDLHYPICWRAITSAHKYGIPSVLTLHGMYGLNPNVLSGKTRFEEWIYRHIFKRILAKANAVIGLTKNITNLAQQYGPKTINYYTIGNGINTDVYKQNLKRKLEFRLKYNIDPDALVILFTGRFEQVKGVIEFATAAKNILEHNRKKVEVVLVGSGTLGAIVHSILDNIRGAHLLEWQPSDKIHEMYIASDIFVIPSRFEGLPITIIEAMNALLHVVYTPVGGIPDILEPYSPKTMLTETSSEEIQRVLITLLGDFPITEKVDDSLLYAQTFDWKNIAYDINEAYKELIVNYLRL